MEKGGGRGWGEREGGSFKGTARPSILSVEKLGLVFQEGQFENLIMPLAAHIVV